MAWNNNGGGQSRGSRVRMDRFGRPSIVKGMRDRSKKQLGILSCAVELGGKLYKIEVSPHSKKEGVDAWCVVTQLGNRQNLSM